MAARDVDISVTRPFAGWGRILPHAIFCWFLLTGFCSAQSFLFVSPNTRDHMSDDSAAEALNSFEQINFLAVAKYLAGKICHQPQVESAEGIYAGTAENSSLITGCNIGQARYLGELLGRYARQKRILIFDPSPQGDERLFVVTISTEHAAETAHALRRYDLRGASITVRDKVVQVYIWAAENSWGRAAHTLAEAEHGDLQEVAGKGALIGDDDRAAAQRVFDRDIRAYERAHRLSWSKQLRSKRLSNMGLQVGH